MPNDDDRGERPVRVVVDAMGGDYAPFEPVKGAIQALSSENIELILVGDPEQVNTQVAQCGGTSDAVTIVPSEGKIGDDEHPLEAIRHKPNSSVVVATKVLKSGDARRAGIHGFHRGFHGQRGLGAGADGRTGPALYRWPIFRFGSSHRPLGHGKQYRLSTRYVAEFCCPGRRVLPQLLGYPKSQGRATKRGV